jgi:YHS domain-containing protein
MRVQRLLWLSAFAAFSLGARAGSFNEKDGVALDGYDPVAYFTDGKAVRGTAENSFEHRGSLFRFASAANRDAFARDPEKFAPQYGGYCAFGASRGYKADTQPTAFTVLDGKLYLNYDATVQRTWLKDPGGYIRKADALWPETAKVEKVLR